MIGSEEEARQIFEAAGDRWETAVLPSGWEEVGDGSTRVAYLSPSGVVYKVCKEYWDDHPSTNANEAQNIEEIKKRELLPQGWHLPEVTLYAFGAYYTQWEARTEDPTKKWGMVDVIACEYIPGEESLIEDTEIDVVFAKVGLYDPTCLNAKIHGLTGKYYIIDAGEYIDQWPTKQLVAA